MSTILRTELEKTYGSGNVTVSKDGDTYTVAITGKSNYTIDSNGKVEKAGPTVAYSNERIVENSAGTGTTVAAGTKTPNTDKLYIYFEASVESGTTSISPSVPFEISANGTYNFTITSTVNGDTFTSSHSVTANQYAVRAGIKIGDYVEYTSPTASVTFNGDETGYSSYATNPATLNRKTLFRVMDIDSEGNMELMGVVTSSDPTINFYGAQGYNNAVYVLNKKCSDLYKNEAKGITARSIKEEDITSRFNSTGTGIITAYIDERVGNIETPTSNTLTTGTYIDSIDPQNKTVTYKTRTYYPNLFQYEAEGKIGDLETGIPETNPKQTVVRSASYNGYGADGILTSADTEGTPATAIPQSLQSATTLTVPYTYSSTRHDANDFRDTTNKTALNSMFFGTGVYYWLASRCVSCDIYEAGFDLRIAGNTYLAAYDLYKSRENASRSYSHVCPIISIPSTVQVTTCTGTNSSSRPHTVVTTN